MKRRIIALLLCLVTVFMFASCGKKKAATKENPSVSADKANYDYELYDAGNCLQMVRINKYKGSAATLVVPETIGNVAVGEIGDNAFQGNTTIKSVTLPSGLLRIGEYAFEGCSALETIGSSEGEGLLPGSITEIGQFAFSRSGLTHSVVLPNGVTVINAGIFEHCEHIASIKLGNAVKKICSQAFINCPELYDVTFFNDVKDVAEDAASKPTVFHMYEHLEGVAQAAIANGITSEEIVVADTAAAATAAKTTAASTAA